MEIANLNLINVKLSSINSGAATISSLERYWSSTEDSYDSRNAFDVYFGNGRVDYYNKNYTYRVRCILAF